MRGWTRSREGPTERHRAARRRSFACATLSRSLSCCRPENPKRGRRSMNMVLVRNWWALALRGVAAIVFGLIAFLSPGVTLAALVLLFGAYALVDGVFAIIAGIRAAERHERWWPLALEGLASILVGV